MTEDRFNELFKKEIDRWFWGAPSPEFHSHEEEVEFRRWFDEKRQALNF